MGNKRLINLGENEVGWWSGVSKLFSDSYDYSYYLYWRMRIYSLLENNEKGEREREKDGESERVHPVI